MEDRPQLYWDAFRRTWRRFLKLWRSGDSVPRWTALIIESAEQACNAYARELGREAAVGREGYGRIDVHATDVETRQLLVAFESELAYWGYNGSSGKDWREEFRKLCKTPAELRVLSSTFPEKTVRRFPGS